MNVIKHRRYVIEFDVWEPTEKQAQKEIDAAILYITQHSTHLGHLKVRLEHEERLHD
jgi:hypothetical protein